MKKIINGLKKIFIMIGTFFSFVYTKVLAVEMQMVEILYGPPPQDLYGVPQPNKLNDIPIFWRIARSLVIPIAFIVGVIIYFKKSSSSILRKVITILIALLIVLLACLGINYFITNLI